MWESFCCLLHLCHSSNWSLLHCVVRHPVSKLFIESVVQSFGQSFVQFLSNLELHVIGQAVSSSR